jgi:co-chaperonin GroES (HSP10)
MVEKKECYRCREFKPLSEFDDNRMKFQLKSQGGKVFTCFECEISDFKRLGYRLQYNQETRVFDILETPKEVWKIFQNSKQKNMSEDLKVKVVGKKVLVLPEKPEDVQKEGALFEVPETLQEVKPRGTVVSVGGKVEEISVGDKVIHSTSIPAAVVIDGVNYFVMLESDIFAILTD